MKTKLSDWWIDEEGYPVLDIADPSYLTPGDEMRMEVEEGDDPAKAKAIADALQEKGNFRVRLRRH